jgi:two-component system sensor histidine kinase PhoQ
MTLSVNARLLLVASLVLAAFFGVTGLVLNQAYVDSAESALRDRLQNSAHMLIAATDIGTDGRVYLAHAVRESRFFTPGSGLYASIVRNDGILAWVSPSLTGISVELPSGFARGSRSFSTLRTADGARLSVFSIGIVWDEAAPAHEIYTLNVAEDQSAFAAQISRFRRLLWGWLAVVALLLLAVQGVILSWGLGPLRRAAADLAAIERGEKDRLAGPYPVELRGLTDNINALVQSERERRERYRHALGDLAHSLKTPLAALRGAVDAGTEAGPLGVTVAAQVERMSQIVQHQLQRAATAGRSALASPIEVAPAVHKVVDALTKVYADKRVACATEIAPEARFNGDEGDLLELLGNLMDNAFKCCRSKVRVLLRSMDGALEISVEDDGPGIAEALRSQVLARGIRGDTAQPGYGIGLAMVQDIVTVYGGLIVIGDSALGGARVTVTL